MARADGSRLWAVYREYEQGLLEEQASEEQAERVRGLWTRQLQVPLADGPDTLAAYLAWERSTRGGPGAGALMGRQAGRRRHAYIAESVVGS